MFNKYAELQLKHFSLRRLGGLISKVFKVSEHETLYEIIEVKLIVDPDYLLGWQCFRKLRNAKPRTNLLIKKWLEIE